MILPILVFLLFVCLLVIYIAFILSLYIRRWHDLGHSGWMSLLSFIPLINLVALLYLLFACGDEGMNAYGEPNVGKPLWSSVFKRLTPVEILATQSAPIQNIPPPQA